MLQFSKDSSWLWFTFSWLKNMEYIWQIRVMEKICYSLFQFGKSKDKKSKSILYMYKSVWNLFQLLTVLVSVVTGFLFIC